MGLGVVKKEKVSNYKAKVSEQSKHRGEVTAERLE
jgi:hypothetical protein